MKCTLRSAWADQHGRHQQINGRLHVNLLVAGPGESEPEVGRQRV